MSLTEEAAELLPGAPLSKAVQLVRRLAWFYGFTAAVIGLILLVGWLNPGFVPQASRNWARELLIGGAGELSLISLLMSVVPLLGAAMMTQSRLAWRRAQALTAAGELDTTPDLFARLWQVRPGVLARQGQAILVTVGAAIILLIAWRLWPAAKPAPLTAKAAGDVVAALLIGLAFPSLIWERTVAAFPAGQMPEQPGLRRLLLLTTLGLALAGLLQVGRGLGFSWIPWIYRGLSAIVVIVTAELALRALARLFLPPPPAETAKGVADSAVTTLLTAGPRAPGMLIRTHLGLDFARSWALRYITKAAVPATVITLLLCWILTGVKLLGDDQRGVYERFGAPVKVLQPGFHVLLPWPLGIMRPVEFGAIHTVAIGANQGPDAFAKEQAVEKIGAEDPPVPSMDRLWDTAHATEATYLVANQSGDQQSFQAVNTEILVLYRTGLTDAAARQSVYGATSRDEVVQQEGARLATRYFSSHTLDSVLGGRRETLQVELRDELQKAIDQDRIGVDVVAVLINEIHPPAGAAAAYHAVQAAEIQAFTTAYQARGRAARAAGVAQQEAHQATTAAQAVAIEKVQGATGDAYQFNADRNAYRASPPAFLLERRMRNLAPALKGVRLTIVDSRLSADQVPIMDFRAGQGADIPAQVTTPAKPVVTVDVPPATSTEEEAPPATREEAAEEARRTPAAPEK